MKKFNIPAYYKSPIIGKLKAERKAQDPRKKDFSPSVLQFGHVKFFIGRHFGFCFGVENAVEKSYQIIQNNPEKRIFLLSEIIHNPDVNDDLRSQGVQFIQNTHGEQQIDWNEINADDIVIIPAFGTTLEIEKKLIDKGIDVVKYDTTCPFVEKVWNRSNSLGEDNFTVIIHGKKQHEETKATFSHSQQKAPTLVVKDLNETKTLADFILGNADINQFKALFENKISPHFNPETHLKRIGVVNQTTMLASETQQIADLLKSTMIQKYGSSDLHLHFADTRDTLCYATNDNQTSTLELLKTNADFAIVVGGYNSSNTTHLVEILQDKFETYFIQDEHEILSKNSIRSFCINTKEIREKKLIVPENQPVKIILTAGASCPDSVLDRVIQKIMYILGSPLNESFS